MSVVAEFTATSTASAELNRSWPDDIRIEIERVVPTEEGIAPYVIVWGAPTDRFVERVRRHPAIESVTPLDTVEGRSLYRTTWDTAVPSALVGVVESRLVLLESTYDENGLWARVRANDREQLAAFLDYCRRNDIEVDVHRVHDFADDPSGRGAQLTPEQAEALRLALERGYYDEPRRASLADLGEELGISRQAVAGRLRRGVRTLLAETFGE